MFKAHVVGTGLLPWGRLSPTNSSALCRTVTKFLDTLQHPRTTTFHDRQSQHVTYPALPNHKTSHVPFSLPFCQYPAGSDFANMPPVSSTHCPCLGDCAPPRKETLTLHYVAIPDVASGPNRLGARGSQVLLLRALPKGLYADERL